METQLRKGFDETSSIPIPQRSPLEISQRGTNEKINTMLKFSENLIMQNIKMKKIITNLADRITKLESIILNGKLQKTIEDTIIKHEKSISDFNKRAAIKTDIAPLTPSVSVLNLPNIGILNTNTPNTLTSKPIEFNKSTELREIPTLTPTTLTPTAPTKDLSEQIRNIAEIYQTKTPGQESTQNLMESLKEHKMLTTPDVNAFLEEESKSDNDSTNSGFHATSSTTDSISSGVLVESLTPTQTEPHPTLSHQPQTEPQPTLITPSQTELKTHGDNIQIVDGELILELENIDILQKTETPAPEELKNTISIVQNTISTEPTNQKPAELIESTSIAGPTIQKPDEPTEPINPLVASSRRRRKQK
jgi:hypothetical protein